MVIWNEGSGHEKGRKEEEGHMRESQEQCMIKTYSLLSTSEQKEKPGGGPGSPVGYVPVPAGLSVGPCGLRSSMLPSCHLRCGRLLFLCSGSPRLPALMASCYFIFLNYSDLLLVTVPLSLRNLWLRPDQSMYSNPWLQKLVEGIPT